MKEHSYIDHIQLFFFCLTMIINIIDYKEVVK